MPICKHSSTNDTTAIRYVFHWINCSCYISNTQTTT